MPMLIIAGVTYDVIAQGATMEKPERLGSSRRAYSGNLRSTVKAEKRPWVFPLAPLTEAQFTTLYNATKSAAQVSCSGDALTGGPYTCEVEIQSADYIKAADQAVDFKRVVTVKLIEV